MDTEAKNIRGTDGMALWGWHWTPARVVHRDDNPTTPVFLLSIRHNTNTTAREERASGNGSRMFEFEGSVSVELVWLDASSSGIERGAES